MARLEWVEERLLNWARWKLSPGGGDLGYAGVELASSNAGRAGYCAQTVIPTSAVDASETEDALAKLPDDMQRAVHAWYLRTGGKAQASAVARMAPSTMFAKIEAAHHRLSEIFGERNRERQAERGRVEQLQNAARTSILKEKGNG